MWSITAKADSNGATEGEILLYDVIGDSCECCQGAKALVNQVRDLGDVENITLRINSAGGDVFEAQAMYSYLRSHPATVTVRVDGLAASAASLVAMAGDRIIMPANALMMIHNPTGLVIGEAGEMRDMAEVLDKIRDVIAAVYMKRTGLAREDILRMMDEETWMTAEEAHLLGFCDEIDGPLKIAASAGCGGGLICRSALGSAALPPELAAKLPEGFRRGASASLSHIHTPAGEGFPPGGNPEKEDEHVEITVTNAAEMEKAFPALVSEVRDEAFQRGASAERERLRALDALAGPGREEILARAKYEEPMDARDVAIELLQADKNASALAARFEDARAVDAALQPQVHRGAAEREEAFMDAIANNINRMRGYAR